MNAFKKRKNIFVYGQFFTYLLYSSLYYFITKFYQIVYLTKCLTPTKKIPSRLSSKKLKKL